MINRKRAARVSRSSPLTFHLLHSGELPFPKIVERMRRGRLEITRVLSQTAAGRVTARAHARVISQSPFVQIGMRQCIHHRDPLVLREVREKHDQKRDRYRKKGKLCSFSNLWLSVRGFNLLHVDFVYFGDSFLGINLSTLPGESLVNKLEG